MARPSRPTSRPTYVVLAPDEVAERLRHPVESAGGRMVRITPPEVVLACQGEGISPQAVALRDGELMVFRDEKGDFRYRGGNDVLDNHELIATVVACGVHR